MKHEPGMKYEPGDVAYIIENGTFVTPVVICKAHGGFCNVCFLDREGAIRIRESRLYDTKEEAEKIRQETRRTTEALMKKRESGPQAGRFVR